jgi:hypothetical protein
MTGELTAQEATEVEALLDVLESLADEIVVADAARDELYARRLAIFLRLTELNITQSVIGDAAKVTPMAVSYALGAHRRREEAAERAPVKRAKKASR